MPLRPPGLLSRALRKLVNTAALLLTIALSSTSLPPVALVGASDSGQAPALGTTRIESSSTAAPASRSSAQVAAARGTPLASSSPVSIAGEARGPAAALEPLAISRVGRLDRRTSITASQASRVEPAPPAPAPATAPAVKKWTGRYNLYRASAFVTQKTFQWCVAASVQMMVNLVRNHKDRTTRTQAKMITYAQRYDNGPWGEGGGTDVTGWINSLRHFGAGNYRAVGATSAARALRAAATAMRQTGRPAGILVMEGRHAWVLHGFESKTDPRSHAYAKINAVRISGPLYPIQQKGGYDPRPNTRLSIKTLARWFKPSSVGNMAGKYVVVIPTH